MGARPGITQKEICRKVRLDRFTVGYHIRELASEGRLEGKRKGRYTVYTVNGRR